MKMPAVALRGMVILPGMIAHFDVSRDKSIHAVEAVEMMVAGETDAAMNHYNVKKKEA